MITCELTKTFKTSAQAGVFVRFWRQPKIMQRRIVDPADPQTAGLRAVAAASVYGAARRKGPLSDGTRVYVDELTFRVVTHATSVE